MGGNGSGRKKDWKKEKEIMQKRFNPKTPQKPKTPAPPAEPVIVPAGQVEDFGSGIEKIKARLADKANEKLDKEPAAPVAPPESNAPAGSVVNGMSYDKDGNIIEPDFDLEATIRRAKGLKPFGKIGVGALSKIICAMKKNKVYALPDEVKNNLSEPAAALIAVYWTDSVELTQKQAYLFMAASTMYEGLTAHLENVDEKLKAESLKDVNSATEPVGNI